MSRRAKFGIWTAVILLAVFFGLRRFEYSQVYSPSKRVIPWDLAKGREREDFDFSTEDGLELNGWFFRAAQDSPRKSLAILVCHGNGGNITYLRKIYERLAATGASVMLFDYRGYGRSTGHPSEEGTYRDAQAAYAWLRDAGFQATNIFVYGESLGGGIASGLAARETVGGLILESTFTCTTDVGVEKFPWLPVRLMSSIIYDTHKRLPQIHAPVLVMHSRADGVVPFKLAQTNFETANDPKMFFEVTGGHVAAEEGCHQGMEKFLAAIEAARLTGREVKF